MFLYLNEQNQDYEELCEVHGLITISSYVIRHYEMTKKHLHAYNKYKAKLPEEFFKKRFEIIDLNIRSFEHEFDNFDHVIPKCDISWQDLPYQGFNINKNIEQMSSACCYVEYLHKNNLVSRVVSNVDLPKASIVLLEKPLSINMNVSLVQCEFCLYHSNNIYTCLECRYKTYCSLKCIENDKDMHQYECPAYKNLLLHILDARDLYRLFVKLSIHLNNSTFASKVFRNVTSAAEVLDIIERNSETEEDYQMNSFMGILRDRPNYSKLHRMQYSTLVATAFRLSLFIESKTNIADIFFSKLQIPKAEKTVLIGVILMRLHCSLLLNSFDFEYVVPLTKVRPKCKTVHDQVSSWINLVKPIRETYTEFINEHYNITNAELNELRTRYLEQKHVFEPLAAPALEHSKLCNSIVRPISVFKDKLAELYFCPDDVQLLIYSDLASIPISSRSISLSIAKMSRLERYRFVQTFASNFHKHFFGYFLRMSTRYNQVHQVLSLQCPTLKKFNHSCIPNVDIVKLDNGLVMGKTLRDVKRGDELLVSYKANYMHHTRVERQTLLKQLNIECHCEICQDAAENEPTDLRQGIYCAKCKGQIITPSQIKCSLCETNFNSLLLKYNTEIALLEKSIRNNMHPNANERTLCLLYEALYLRARASYVPSNEYRIKVELGHAKYLALKNFGRQAYFILLEVKSNVTSHYTEDVLWFSFFSEMLLIIKIIMYYTIEKQINNIPVTNLQDLCTLALYIINGGLSYICQSQSDNSEYSSLFEDAHLFLKWRSYIYRCSSAGNVLDNAEATENIGGEIISLIKANATRI
ncbi:uncharacterized protein LOC101463250 isoform X2 [Ceratitis capitata]|nr:uncharacterized protein LOC101463250 isoform X2 [Ceratitis capitata]XP_020715361.1 uncharacterized protein LOC101463250 isoform X2 [Ceratitis capitata]